MRCNLELNKPTGHQLFCLDMGNGWYAALDSYNNVMETTKAYAEIFNSIEDALEFCRRYWIQAKVVIWKGDNHGE